MSVRKDFILVIPIPSDGVICETGHPKLVKGVGIYDAVGANWY
jgi:hypothetical protein